MAAANTNLPPPIKLKNSLGPSFILLGLALGSGELILWPYLVSQYGLGIIWGGLLGITLQFFMNTEVMRYTLAVGESVFVGWRRFGKSIPWWFVLSTAIPWAIPGFSSASGQIMHKLLPFIPEKTLAIIFLLLTGVILSMGKTLYKTVETFQKTLLLLGLPFIFFITLYLARGTDWLALLQGFTGQGDGWRWFPPGIAIGAFLGAFAYSGAGGNLGIAQSYYIKEKGFGMGRYYQGIKALIQGSLNAVRIDGKLFTLNSGNLGKFASWWRLVVTEHFIVFWGLGLLTIILLAVLSAATAKGASSSGIEFVFFQAETIARSLGSIVGTIFLVVAALFLFSTQLGVLESATRIVSENILLLRHQVHEPVSSSRTFYLILWLEIFAGFLMLQFGIQEPRLLLTLGAILNAAAMMVAFPLIYLLNVVRLPVQIRPSATRKLILILSFFIFAYFVFETIKSAL